MANHTITTDANGVKGISPAATSDGGQLLLNNDALLSALLTTLRSDLNAIELTPGPIGLTGQKGDKGDQGTQGVPGVTGVVTAVGTSPLTLTYDANAKSLTGSVDLSQYLTQVGNLAGLADKATARTNLGLGTAAVLNTGTAPGNIPTIGGSAGLTILGAIVGGSVSGVGSGITQLNASNIATGTLDAARLPNLSTAYLSLSGGGTVAASTTINVPAASAFGAQFITAFTAGTPYGQFKVRGDGAITAVSGQFSGNLTTQGILSAVTIYGSGANITDITAAQVGALPINGGTLTGTLNAPAIVADISGVTGSRKEKTITISPPTANENVTIFRTAKAITLNSLTAVVSGGTTAQNFTIRYDTSRNATGTVLTSGSTSDHAGTTPTTLNVTVPAGSFVWLTTDGTTPTVTELSITLTYKES